MEKSKNYKIIVSIVKNCLNQVESFADKIDCLSDIKALDIYMEQAADGLRVSPEAMSDPENLTVIRKRYDRNRERHFKAHQFYDEIKAGKYKTDLALDVHPEFFVFLGVEYKATMNFTGETDFKPTNSFVELLGDDGMYYFVLLLLALDSIIDELVNKVSDVWPSRQDECDGNCCNCQHHNVKDNADTTNDKKPFHEMEMREVGIGDILRLIITGDLGE